MSAPAVGALLAREAAQLVARLRLFTPARWAAADPPHDSRGGAVHHLAASFAVAAGEAPVALPRLDSDLALPDQLAVTADDLVRSGRVGVEHVAHLLLHRARLLDEQVPAGLAARLGLPDVDALLALGSEACSSA